MRLVVALGLLFVLFSAEASQCGTIRASLFQKSLSSDPLVEARWEVPSSLPSVEPSAQACSRKAFLAILSWRLDGKSLPLSPKVAVLCSWSGPPFLKEK